MRRGFLLLMIVALSFVIFSGCASKCDPIFKDIHVWWDLPDGDDAAKARLGKFVDKKCEGSHDEWAWKAPQEDTVSCRDYKGSPQVARLIGKNISKVIIDTVNDISGAGLDADDGDYMRMKASFVEECGFSKAYAGKLAMDSPVCDADDKDLKGDYKPYWYVRRTYKMNWRNSYKPSHKDIVKINIKKEEIAKALPGIMFDAGAEAQKKGVIVFKFDEGVWGAYRASELLEWYCYKAQYSAAE